MRYSLAVIIIFISIHCLQAQISDTEWPLFRGKADLTGKYDYELPANPQLLWSASIGARTKSSPVVSEGTIYFGNDKGALIAVSADGKIKWKYEA